MYKATITSTRSLIYTKNISDTRRDFTIAGLEELICQVDQNNNINYLNDGMVKLLGGNSKSEMIDTQISSWDYGLLGDGFLESIISSARNNDQTVIIENVVENIPQERLPRSCSETICGPMRLRFVCSPISGRVQIVVQDITHSHWLESTFSKYLAPNVISQLRNVPEDQLLRTEKRIATVLFADVRGFTLYCQRATAEEVGFLINDFLECAVGCIEKHEGMVDKFIGDCIMALWGVPLAKADHALKALLASVDMINAYKEITQSRKSSGKEYPPIGVGLATGEVIVGNIGTTKRMEYTALGHTVNLSARLCGVAGPYEIITVSDTHKAAFDAVKKYDDASHIPRFIFEKKAKVDLKNILKSVSIYRVSV